MKVNVMHVRYPKPMKRLFCGMGLSAFLVSPAAKLLLNQLVASAFADDVISFRTVEVVPELPRPASRPMNKAVSRARGSGGSSAADLEPPIEIVGHRPIPTVSAHGYGTRVSSPRPQGNSAGRPPSRRQLPLAEGTLNKAPAEAATSSDISTADADLGVPIEIVGNKPIPMIIAAGFEMPVPLRPPGDSIRRRLGGQRLALEKEALDQVRGGFEPPDSNLKFSFGIERAVYINGQLVTSTVLNLKDLQGLSGAGATQVMASGIDASGLLVVQNGGGNAFQVQVGPNGFGTVIQNTLDNQKIQSVTTINAAVNSAAVLRAMSVQSAIQDGLVNSLRR